MVTLNQVEVQPVFSPLPCYGRFKRVEPPEKDPSSGTAVFHMKTKDTQTEEQRGHREKFSWWRGRRRDMDRLLDPRLSKLDQVGNRSVY